jgi:hypothetical protein
MRLQCCLSWISRSVHKLAGILEERQRQDNVSNVLFYLAVADRFAYPYPT